MKQRVIMKAATFCFFLLATFSAVGRVKAQSTGQYAQVELTASNGVADVQFGYSVAAYGSFVVVGALEMTIGSNSDQGAAYAFSCPTASNCTQEAELTASDGAADDGFGYSVAIYGSLVVVGAYYKTIGSNSAQGAAYVFSCPTASNCAQGAELTASNGAASDYFGTSVAVYGSLVVVGAYGKNSAQGAAYVFSCPTASNCTQESELTASDGASNDWFGYSVAIYGSLVVVGAYGKTIGSNSYQGATYVFSCPTASDCIEEAELTASNGASDDYFGISVAIFDSLVVVGASFKTIGSNNDQGAAYSFACNSSGCQCATGWTGVDCDTCVDGYYQSSNTTCSPCSENCAACIDFATVCMSCSASYYLSSTTCLHSATMSATQSATASETQSATASFTQSATASDTQSATASGTQSPTATLSATESDTQSATVTLSATGSATQSVTATLTATGSATRSATLSSTYSASDSYTESQTATISATDSFTISVTASATVTRSSTASDTASLTYTQTATASATANVAASATASFTETSTASATASFTQSATATATATTTPAPSSNHTCPPNCATCSNATLCTSCASGYNAVQGTCVPQIYCPSVNTTDAADGYAWWTTPTYAGFISTGSCAAGYIGQPSRQCLYTNGMAVWGAVSSPCLAVVSVPVTMTGNCSGNVVAAQVTSATLSGSVILSLSTTIASCFVLAAPVSITWSAGSQVPSAVASLLNATHAMTIPVPTSLLPPGTYTFVANVIAQSASATANANASSTVTVATLPPVALLTPNVQSAPAAYNQPLVLNASASYDPNAGATGVSCAWSSAIILFNTTSCVQTIPANTLATGSSYVFNVTVTSLQYGTSSSTSVVVAAQGSVSAVVSVAAQGVSASGVIGLQSYTRLAGSFSLASGYTATAQTTVAYTWSCAVVSGAAACPDLADFKNTVASAPNSNNLVLFPHVLTAGAQYSLRLTVATTSPPGSGFGEVYVTANQLPADGSFAVTPLQGVQFQDVFTLLVGGWVDPEGGSLQYNYIAQSSQGQSSLLSQPGSQDSIFTSSLPLGQIQLWATVVDDTGDYVLTIQIAVNVTSNITSLAQIQSVATQQLQQYVVFVFLLPEIKKKIFYRATQSQDPSVILQIVSAVAQLLATSGSSDNGLAAQVRYNLTVAIQSAASLQDLSASNVAVLVQALDSVASNPSQLSADSIQLTLSLTTQLASLAGSAAQQFLTIITNFNTYIASTQQQQSTEDAAQQAATIQANIASVVTSLLESALCGQQAQSINTGGLQVTGQKSSDLGNSTFDSNNSSASFGSAFNPVADACTEVRLKKIIFFS